MPLALAAIATGATFIVAYTGYLMFQDRFPASFLGIWERWDTIHYIEIARDGYGTDEAQRRLIMWPPLYSWLMRGIAPLAGGYLHAGLLISFACYAAATAVLYRLVALDFPERVARRTILYLAIFPTSYFFHAAYTESLFVMLAVGSFLAARRERWGMAGALGGLAALTRVTWFALLPALVVEYLIQKRFRLRAVRLDALWLLLMPAGFGVFLLINRVVYGDFLQFLEVARTTMFKELSPPWVGMERVIAAARGGGASRFVTIGVFETVSGIGGLLAAVWCLFRMRASYSVYMLAAWVNIACNTWWVSTARYLIALFPGFVMLALWGERRAVHTALCFLFLMTYTLLLTLFVRGWWTY